MEPVRVHLVPFVHSQKEMLKMGVIPVSPKNVFSKEETTITTITVFISKTFACQDKIPHNYV